MIETKTELIKKMPTSFLNFKFNANAATTHTRLNSIEYLELDNDKCERIQ